MAVKAFTPGDKGSKPKKESGGPSTNLGRGKVNSRYGNDEASLMGQPFNQPKPVGGFQAPSVADAIRMRDALLAQTQTPGTGGSTSIPSPGLGTGGATGTAGVGSPTYGLTSQAPDSFSGAGNTAMNETMANLGYSPQGASTLYQNPEVLAADVLAQLGIDNPAMASVIGDSFWPFLYAQMMQTGGYGDQSDPATMARVYDLMTQYVTPGGTMPDANAMMQTIFGAGPESGPLGASLAMGDPQSQVDSVGNALQAARYGMNPLMQKAYKNAQDWYATQYLTGALKNPSAADPYTSFLANSPMADWSR